MAEIEMQSRVILPHHTASVWSSNNPILMQGELGYESDTLKYKFGDGVTAWDASNGGYKVLSTANMHAPRILWSGLDLSFPNNSWRMEYDYIQSGTLVPVMFGHEDESGVGPSAVCSGQDQIGFNTSVWAHEINWLNAMHHRKVMIDNVIKRDDDTAYSGTQIYYYPENFTSTHKSYIGIGQHWFWSGRYCYVKNLKIFNTI